MPAQNVSQAGSKPLRRPPRASTRRCARVDAGALRAGELGDELRRLGAAEVGLRQELEEATERVTAAEVELARLDAETREATRRLRRRGRACRRR